MEILLSKYSNFLSGWKEVLTQIQLDEINHSTNNNTSQMKSFHFTSLLHGIFVEQKGNVCFLLPRTTRDIMYFQIEDQDNIDEQHNNKMQRFQFFGDFFNFLKNTFRVNLQCAKYLKIQQFKMNTKEIYNTINLYASKADYYLILKYMKHEKPLADSMVMALDSKIQITNINKLLPRQKGEMPLIDELKKDMEILFKNDIEDNYHNSYNNSNISNEIIQSSNSPNSKGKLFTYTTEHSDFCKEKYNLDKIDKIRELNLSMFRLLIEIRRTLTASELLAFNEFTSEAIPSTKSIFPNSTTSSQTTIPSELEHHEKQIASYYTPPLLNRLDIYARIIFAKVTDDIAKEFPSQNNELLNKYETVNDKNIELKDTLNDYLNKNPRYIYHCFKCGNILFPNNKLEVSTCNFDETCTSVSLFNCSRCNIKLCTYCFFFPKNLQCTKMHSLRSLVYKEDKVCTICQKIIPHRIQCAYSCTECIKEKNKLTLCAFCMENFKSYNYLNHKCTSCKREVSWRRGVYSKCAKCNKKAKCFWFCFICKLNFCIKCFNTNKLYCGANHKMEEKNLNTYILNKHQPTKMKKDKEQQMILISQLMKCRSKQTGKFVNHKLYDVIHGYEMLTHASCDECQKQFNYRMFICYRCLFIKCPTCMETSKVSLPKKVYI